MMLLENFLILARSGIMRKGTPACMSGKQFSWLTRIIRVTQVESPKGGLLSNKDYGRNP